MTNLSSTWTDLCYVGVSEDGVCDCIVVTVSVLTGQVVDIVYLSSLCSQCARE